MVESFVSKEIPRQDEMDELLRIYQEIETAVHSDNFEPEQIAYLVDRSEELIGLMMDADKVAANRKQALFQEKLAHTCEELLKLIALLQVEKEQLSQQLNTLKTGRSALNAYQKPRLGMGFTEGKFLDNKK